ncbi:MAG: methyltransferase domain-containing protein [candidate division WOR-3 bacterium]|nr:MAG: methyltransferase domain-containing protein [candidate division WOR-3 bacterium]
MPKRYDYTMKDVQEVYDGPGGLLWEAVMSEQIHSGAERTTEELAQALGLQKGQHVLDVCSALGAPARHIAKKYGVKVTGLDMTRTMNEKAVQRTKEAGLDSLIDFVEGNGMDMPFKANTFDVVWGQEAWCYVTNKDQLAAECFRVLKPGGKLGFTDWVITGKVEEDLLAKLYESMSFPYMETYEGWQGVLKKAGFKVLDAQDQTEDYAKCFDEYKPMVEEKLKPTIIKNFGEDLFGFATGLVNMWRDAAHAHKVGRGFYIAEKPK